MSSSGEITTLRRCLCHASAILFWSYIRCTNNASLNFFFGFSRVLINAITDTSEETEAQYQLISRNFIPIYFNYSENKWRSTSNGDDTQYKAIDSAVAILACLRMIRAFDKKVSLFSLHSYRSQAYDSSQRDTQSVVEIKRVVKRTRDSLLFDFSFGDEDLSKSRCFIGKYSELV